MKEGEREGGKERGEGGEGEGGRGRKGLTLSDSILLETC